jgi:hypothetical protein
LSMNTNWRAPQPRNSVTCMGCVRQTQPTGLPTAVLGQRGSSQTGADCSAGIQPPAG